MGRHSSGASEERWACRREAWQRWLVEDGAVEDTTGGYRVHESTVCGEVAVRDRWGDRRSRLSVHRCRGLISAVALDPSGIPSRLPRGPCPVHRYGAVFRNLAERTTDWHRIVHACDAVGADGHRGPSRHVAA